jgi:hypothetical protein
VDPDYAVKKARVEHLHAIADREVVPEAGQGGPGGVFGLGRPVPALALGVSSSGRRRS